MSKSYFSSSSKFIEKVAYRKSTKITRNSFSHRQYSHKNSTDFLYHKIIHRSFCMPSIGKVEQIKVDHKTPTLSSQTTSDAVPNNIQTTKQSFHKRPLPTSLISFSSPTGRELFQQALIRGGMESYFPLSEQFVTQSEPSFCALSSLSMVLNALNFDPKKVWKGAWRWVSEETLQCESLHICGHSLDRIKEKGMDFNEFVSLAICHGVNIEENRVNNIIDSIGYDKFKKYVEFVSSNTMANMFIICNFSRKTLSQTGSGHFSPIGGYHAEKELVLIMDVARFKYPPYWVPLRVLWSAMSEVDSNTSNARGYFVISTKNESNGKATVCENMLHNHHNDHNNCNSKN
eukprot:gene8724-11786_t